MKGQLEKEKQKRRSESTVLQSTTINPLSHDNYVYVALWFVMNMCIDISDMYVIFLSLSSHRDT